MCRKMEGSEAEVPHCFSGLGFPLEDKSVARLAMKMHSVSFSILNFIMLSSSFYNLMFFSQSHDFLIDHTVNTLGSTCDVQSPLVSLQGEGNGTPLQYSCLENPMDGGGLWAAVHAVVKSRT